MALGAVKWMRFNGDFMLDSQFWSLNFPVDYRGEVTKAAEVESFLTFMEPPLSVPFPPYRVKGGKMKKEKKKGEGRGGATPSAILLKMDNFACQLLIQSIVSHSTEKYDINLIDLACLCRLRCLHVCSHPQMARTNCWWWQHGGNLESCSYTSSSGLLPLLPWKHLGSHKAPSMGKHKKRHKGSNQQGQRLQSQEGKMELLHYVCY